MHKFKIGDVVRVNRQGVITNVREWDTGSPYYTINYDAVNDRSGDYKEEDLQLVTQNYKTEKLSPEDITEIDAAVYDISSRVVRGTLHEAIVKWYKKWHNNKI